MCGSILMWTNPINVRLCIVIVTVHFEVTLNYKRKLTKWNWTKRNKRNTMQENMNRLPIYFSDFLRINHNLKYWKVGNGFCKEWNVFLKDYRECAFNISLFCKLLKYVPEGNTVLNTYFVYISVVIEISKISSL